MAIELPYSDRFDDDDRRREAAWADYDKSLEEAGFHTDEPIYQYFVGDAFHDSPIHVSFFLDLDATNLKFNMRNIRLLDDVDQRFDVDIEGLDFHTDVTFVKCHHVDMKLDLTKQHWYQGSAISLVNGLIEVVIAVSLRVNEKDQFDDCIRIVAEDVQVEDISQRISDRYGIERKEIEQIMRDWHSMY